MDLALIVDDSNICSFIAQTVILETKKFKDSMIQPSGFSATSYLNQSAEDPQKYPWPDLILLDIRMPVVDGHKFIEEFSKYPWELRKKTTLVIMSSEVLDLRIQSYIEEGKVSRFISKPLRVKHMEELLNSFAA